MKDQMFRAEDGALFTKAKDCRMYNEIQRHSNKKAEMNYYVAVRDIETLKCRAFLSEAETEPTNINISNCRTLPRIEQICKRAREAYINALNENGRIDNYKRVHKIADAASIYDYAITRRKQLIAEFNMIKVRANDAYREIYAAKMLKNNCEV